MPSFFMRISMVRSAFKIVLRVLGGLARLLHFACEWRKRDMELEKLMREMALKEFGSLDGVTITFTRDAETGRVTYVFSRELIPRKVA